MAEVRNPTEPSMEEILASIRRIIIDDEDPLPKSSAEQGEVAVSAAVAAPTQVLGEAPPLRVEEMDAPVAVTPANFEPQHRSSSSPPQDSNFDLSSRTNGVDVMRHEPETISSASIAPANPDRLHQPPALTGTADGEPHAARLAASVAALTKVASIGQPRRQPELPLGDVGRTLEDMVRELLRPHMKDWLDAHLPQLVERLVREEIARLVREAQQH
jgi:uncharacterized protein